MVRSQARVNSHVNLGFESGGEDGGLPAQPAAPSLPEGMSPD